MEILTSNFPPVETNHKNFNDRFEELFADSDRLDIAVGYISEKSLNYLTDRIYKHGKIVCNIVIGMHYFDRFTRSEFTSAIEMERFLKDNEIGSVKLVKSFPFHGKLYSFSRKNEPSRSIVGSSNLKSILPNNSIRSYEFDLLVEDEYTNKKINKFINSLIDISPDLSKIDVKISDSKEINNLLEDFCGVKKIENQQIMKNYRDKIIQDKAIRIPIKSCEKAPRSNINTYRGKGRKNQNGLVRRRHWYEVELIVPKSITDIPWYPKPNETDKKVIITVITDDGYKFKCQASGDYSKNFRSVGDLTILGRWLKGRLECAGVLKIGEPVTKDVLNKYGRNDVEMSPTSSIEEIWYLDFSTKRDR